LPLNRAWVDSPLAVGEDGTLYFTTDTWGLYAINPDRTQKWGLTIGESKSIPAFGSDGTVYVNSYINDNDQRLLAIAPDGSVKWKFIRVSSSNSIRNSETSSPAVAADGTIYTGGSRDYKLYAVNPDDGTKKWEYKAGDVVNTPVVGPDGTIYFESYKNLYAIRPNGTKKWILPIQPALTDNVVPAIGSEGTIYVSSAYNSKLYAVNPDGTIKWSKDYQVETSPAVGADGTVYVGANKKLLAVGPDGKLKWELAGGEGRYTTPRIGDDGTVYFANQGVCYAVDPSSGKVKWTFDGVDDGHDLAIGTYGTIYVAGYGRSNVFALGKVADSIRIDKSAITLQVGASETLVATVVPEDAPNKNVKWSSSNSTIAAVDGSGQVKGIAPGKAKIIATAEDGGFTAICTVTVTAAANP